MKVCIECGADEVQTWRKGQCIATSIDPTTRLCIDCLPKRTAAAPIGPLFDRNAFDHEHRSRADVPRETTRTSSMTARTHDDEPEQENP
jgi:hypothetical protein